MTSPAKYFKRQCKPHLTKRITSSFIFFYKEIYSDQRAKNPELKTSVVVCYVLEQKMEKFEERIKGEIRSDG